MLVGEDFGGSHESGLKTVLYRSDTCQSRHHGLARPHFPLQQPIHRDLTGNVPRDFIPNLALPGSELERQPCHDL